MANQDELKKAQATLDNVNKDSAPLAQKPQDSISSQPMKSPQPPVNSPIKDQKDNQELETTKKRELTEKMLKPACRRCGGEHYITSCIRPRKPGGN